MKKVILMALVGLLFIRFGYSQKEGYIFKEIKTLPATPVKNQYRSGTCWAFSGISFFESELLRMGKGEYDLSEMFVVRNAYADKADKYVRMHGNINFAGGGAFNDVTMVISEDGIVPEEVYSGMNYGTEKHVHSELDNIFLAYMKAVIENKNRELSTAWKPGFRGLLDAYLGNYPENFSYKGQQFTPESFKKNLGLNMDDYVMVTSFAHHPYYSSFILEVPDNWGWGDVYNVKLEELTDIIDNSIKEGYTVAWATDVSEKGFSWKQGIAIVPSENIDDLDGLERTKWDELSELERQKLIYDFSTPKKEKKITPEMRQKDFDNYETTDDHGMHITGLAEDQKGNIFYRVKNSWGTEGSPYDGYLYVSKPFVLFKTTSILVNKAGIPKDIRKKLGI